MRFLFPYAVALLVKTASVNAAAVSTLPVVDLKTSVHQATLSTDGSYLSFFNIPYAESPLGALRFAPPAPRTTVDRTVNGDATPRLCPQGGPGWFGVSVPYVLETIAKGPQTLTSRADPVESEDCLLLDIHVPKAAFDAAQKRSKRPCSGVPVIVWIHGGAYVAGSKNENAVGSMMAQSVADGRSGAIVVNINYRLGLFGFPPRKEGEDSIASNAGLLDQRLALEWVRKNIWKFGGNGASITAMGESAGAGSILAHMTAFGGHDGVAPFKRAVVQSPALKPATGPRQYAEIREQFLALAGVASMEEARGLSSEALIGFSAAMVGGSAFGAATFAPNVDGHYIPDEPGKLLLNKAIDKRDELIVAHNPREGLLFTDTRVSDQAGFTAFIAGLLPTTSEGTVAQVAAAVYPEDYSGAQPYTTPTGRVELSVAEMIVSCYAYALNLARGNTTRGYHFSRFPGMHAQDVSYTWYSGAAADGWGVPVPAETALMMQGWFLDFAARGFGAGSSAAGLPVYGPGAAMLDINDAGLGIISDPAANARCNYLLSVSE